MVSTIQGTFGLNIYNNELIDIVLQLSKNRRDLNNAWDIYYHVFRRITRHLPQLTSLELQYVSPNLLCCRDLELAIPGSYNPGHAVVRIAYIHSSLEVFHLSFNFIYLEYELI